MLTAKSNALPRLYNQERHGDNPRVPKARQPQRGARRAFGTAALIWNLWRRLPARRRRQLFTLARKHGPRLIKRAFKARRRSRRPFR